MELFAHKAKLIYFLALRYSSFYSDAFNVDESKIAYELQGCKKPKIFGFGPICRSWDRFLNQNFVKNRSHNLLKTDSIDLNFEK